MTFAHLGHVVAQNVNMPLVGTHQPERELEDGALPRTGDAQNRLGLALFQVKRNSIKHSLALECDGDILENDDVVRRTGFRRSALFNRSRRRGHDYR